MFLLDTDIISHLRRAEHWLTVVTRNVADFAPTGVPTLNPFTDPA